jgi:hypothetical protein
VNERGLSIPLWVASEMMAAQSVAGVAPSQAGMAGSSGNCSRNLGSSLCILGLMVRAACSFLSEAHHTCTTAPAFNPSARVGAGPSTTILQQSASAISSKIDLMLELWHTHNCLPRAPCETVGRTVFFFFRSGGRALLNFTETAAKHFA